MLCEFVNYCYAHATAIAGLATGTVSIADQIIENGEVTDPLAVAADVFESASDVAIDSIGSAF